LLRPSVVVRATSTIGIRRHRAIACAGITNALPAAPPRKDRVAGNRDQLVGKIQNSYGIGKDEAEKQLKEWESSQSDKD